jgi:hypothetical protein
MALVYAVYRVLYGEDYIQESITSIAPYVDRIFVFWTDRPWGNIQNCVYQNRLVYFPKKFDQVVQKITALAHPKIHLLYDHVEQNLGQFTHLVNERILPDYPRPQTILFLEHDMVFRSDQIEQACKAFDAAHVLCATTAQIELWRTPHWRIPARKRLASVFWNLTDLDAIPVTGRHADPINYVMPCLPATVHNFGFCLSPENMYWKHLTALGFSQRIGDSLPNEDWYEKKWLNWNPLLNNTHLEMSRGWEHLIPYAEPYDVSQLPEIIKKKYHLC